MCVLMRGSVLVLLRRLAKRNVHLNDAVSGHAVLLKSGKSGALCSLHALQCALFPCLVDLQ